MQKRFSVKVPLLVSFKDSLYQKLIRLQSNDISEGGLCFETSRRIPVSATTRVQVSTVGNLPKEAWIEGHVVYRDKNRDTRRYVVGVVFDEFVNVSPDELVSHLERWEDPQPTPV